MYGNRYYEYCDKNNCVFWHMFNIKICMLKIKKLCAKGCFLKSTETSSGKITGL